MASRKPKAPAVEVPPAVPKSTLETAKPKAKAKPKPKVAKPAPLVEVAKNPTETIEPPKPAELPKPTEPLSPEEAKIQQYFPNPKSKVSGKYRTKVLEWIALYETIGTSHEVWKKPNPITVWEDPKHEFHGEWSRFMEGMVISDAEALCCVALDNRVTALEQMLVA